MVTDPSLRRIVCQIGARGEVTDLLFAVISDSYLGYLEWEYLCLLRKPDTQAKNDDSPDELNFPSSAHKREETPHALLKYDSQVQPPNTLIQESYLLGGTRLSFVVWWPSRKQARDPFRSVSMMEESSVCLQNQAIHRANLIAY